MAQNVSVLRLVQFLADERGAFQADLHGRVAAPFQPVHEPRDLRGTARTVRAFDDNQFARQFLEFTPGMPWP